MLSTAPRLLRDHLKRAVELGQTHQCSTSLGGRLSAIVLSQIDRLVAGRARRVGDLPLDQLVVVESGMLPCAGHDQHAAIAQEDARGVITRTSARALDDDIGNAPPVRRMSANLRSSSSTATV